MVHALQNVPGVVDAYSLGEKEKGVFEVSVESTPDNDIRRDVFALMARKGWPHAGPEEHRPHSGGPVPAADQHRRRLAAPARRMRNGGAPQLDP